MRIIAVKPTSSPTPIPSETPLPSATFTQAPLPDLVISTHTINPPTPGTGQPVAAQVAVKNQSDGTAANFDVVWYYDSTAPNPTCSWTVGTLAPNETLTFTCNYAGYQSQGTYQAIAIVDGNNIVFESNEDNNQSVVVVEVKASQP